MKSLKNLLFIVVFSISIVSAHAQTREEFAKQREKEMKLSEKSKMEGINSQESEYKKYIEKRDKAFSEYLKKRWTEFQVYSGIELSESPKPNKPPIYDPNDKQKNRDVPQIKLKVKTVSPTIGSKSDDLFADKLLIMETSLLSEKNTDDILFNYFGADITIPTDKNLLQPINYSLSEKGFAEYWNAIATTEYNSVVSSLANYADQLKLNDWAYFMLVEKYADRIHANDKNRTQLLTWFLLLKSGYKVKIAYSGKQLSLMVPAIQQIYGNSFIRMGNINYYMTNQINGSVFTYEGNLEGSTKEFQMDFNKELALPIQRNSRKLNFRYEEQDYTVSIAFNQNLVAFYNAYPNVDLNIHFNTPVSGLTAKSIKHEFNQILTGRSKEDQANLLLTFIHKALPYKTDGEQFGKEKFFFVEDIFSFSYSDCEDRSVLYSYLIDNLVGLKTIGIDAPGHVFTAVNFNGIQGDYIDFEGKSFTICDPTYIGAHIGKIMPNMNNNLKVIPKK